MNTATEQPTYAWQYQGKPFEQCNIGKAAGFVYLIKCTANGMSYVGKKLFTKSVKKRVVKKGAKADEAKAGLKVKDMTEEERNARLKVVRGRAESDWQDYFGSSEELMADMEKYGKEAFTREILELSRSKGELAYLELKHQMAHDALRRADYYNGIINVRLHRHAVFSAEERSRAYQSAFSDNPQFARTHTPPQGAVVQGKRLNPRDADMSAEEWAEATAGLSLEERVARILS